MTLWKWSQTSAANATADPSINWAEGQSPSSVNDSGRAMMSAAAKYRDDHAGSLLTDGIATAYTVITNQVFDTLAHLSGRSLKIRFHTTSGAAPTLNVDSLGDKALQSADGTAITTGLLVADSIYDVTYDNSIPAFIVNGVAGLQPTSENLTAISGLTSAADKVPYFTGSGTAGVADFTSAGRAVVGGADASAQRTSLGLGTLAVKNTIDNANLIDSSVLTSINPFGTQLGHYRDVQTSGTAGATYSSGAWRTVRLNTSVTTEISGISLSSNQLTNVPAGTYYVRAISPFTSTSGATDFVAQGRLQNITDTSTILLGINVGNGGSGETLKYGQVLVEGRFTLGGTKTIEFQFQGTTACTGGKPGSFGSEIYASVFLWKLA